MNLKLIIMMLFYFLSMSIYPEELATINNPDILDANLKDYKEFTIKINEQEYRVYLMTNNDYVHKDGKFTAIHNLDDNLLNKLDEYEYLSYMNDGWNINNVNEMLNQCDNCKSYYFDKECKKCSSLIVEKYYIQKKYFHIPIDRCEYLMDGIALKTKIYIDNELIMNFDISTEVYPIFWYPLDLEQSDGQILTLTIDPGDLNRRRTNKITNKIKHIFKLQNKPLVDKQIKTIKPLYRHYQHGYCGDLNGLVYFNEVFHMFYQNDPFMTEGVNMFWGHATSKDLYTWEDKGLALKPYIDANGQCFSGSGNVKDGKMFFMFTDTCGGETLAFYDNKKNKIVPDKIILKHTGRDPKVIKYKDHWVMIVSYIGDIVKEFRFYVSDDLYNWRHTCSISNMYECPEFIKFDVKGVEKWVLFEASNKYLIGTFDGEIFTPDSNDKYQSQYGSFNASQCFTNYRHNVQMGNITFSNSQSYKNTFSTPLLLHLTEVENLYQLSMSFITNLKPEKIIANGIKQKLWLENGYMVIKGATNCIIHGKMGCHINDNNFEYNNEEKKDIEILADKFVYEVLIGDYKYFSAEKCHEYKLSISIDY